MGAHTLVDTANYMLGILWLVPQEARVVFSARCSQSTKIGSGLVKVSPMKRRHTPPPLHLRLGSTPNAGIRRYEELGNVLSLLLKPRRGPELEALVKHARKEFGFRATRRLGEPGGVTSNRLILRRSGQSGSTIRIPSAKSFCSHPKTYLI